MRPVRGPYWLTCLDRAMLRDPTRYSEPDLFRPDRFLASDGAEPEYDPRHIVFGFGRR